jgi:hypothetical protein
MSHERAHSSDVLSYPYEEDGDILTENFPTFEICEFFRQNFTARGLGANAGDNTFDRRDLMCGQRDSPLPQLGPKQPSVGP